MCEPNKPFRHPNHQWGEAWTDSHIRSCAWLGPSEGKRHFRRKKSRKRLYAGWWRYTNNSRRWHGWQAVRRMPADVRVIASYPHPCQPLDIMLAFSKLLIAQNAHIYLVIVPPFLLFYLGGVAMVFQTCLASDRYHLPYLYWVPVYSLATSIKCEHSGLRISHHGLFNTAYFIYLR